jgi:hypothetical protein
MLVIAALAQVRKQRHGLVIAAHRLAVDQAGTNSITCRRRSAACREV